MPYINESRIRDNTIRPDIWPTGGPVATPFLVSGSSAAQYGWRSEGEYDAAYAEAYKSQSRHWADTISTIDALDRIDRAMSNPVVRGGGLSVHDRRYTYRDYVSAQPSITVKRTGNPDQTCIANLYAKITTLPPVMTDSDIRAQGGSMLRESRPTKPHANLSQWFGELTQFGGMFDVPRELPKELQKYGNSSLDELRRLREGGRAVGSGYLAGQFGWLPFIGEVIKSLDAIANSGPLIDDFVRNSAKLIHRSRRKILYQETETVSGSLQASASASSFTKAGVAFQLRRESNASYWGYNSTMWYDFNATVTRTDELRSSAVFEYFVADPGGFLGSSQNFAQKAKYLLGDPLISLSTFWELAPWSWAIDWHFNLGSLLSFQESVATDGLVMHRGCTVWESRSSVVVHWTPRLDYYSPRPGIASYIVGNPSAISIANGRNQIRLGGGPYDMGIDWSGYNSRQWFILGALGLAKAPGVKP